MMALSPVKQLTYAEAMSAFTGLLTAYRKRTGFHAKSNATDAKLDQAFEGMQKVVRELKPSLNLLDGQLATVKSLIATNTARSDLNQAVFFLTQLINNLKSPAPVVKQANEQKDAPAVNQGVAERKESPAVNPNQITLNFN